MISIVELRSSNLENVRDDLWKRLNHFLQAQVKVALDKDVAIEMGQEVLEVRLIRLAGLRLLLERLVQLKADLVPDNFFAVLGDGVDYDSFVFGNNFTFE